MKPNSTILGAGSFGTALALLTARNGCQTLLWGHEAAHIAQLHNDRENRHFLSGFQFPDNLHVTASLEKAAAFSNLFLIAVPSHGFKETLVKLKPLLNKDAKITWVTKGLNPEDGTFLHQVVYQIFSEETAIAILSGPTFAREIAAGLPTAITISSPDKQFAIDMANLLHSDRFRAYTCSDIIGVQIGGAIKNVLAIAAGIADGLGFGANTRAALITRGLAEMMRLGIALDAQRDTLMGLAGLGDLILTCTDDQSRNRSFGMALGKGKNKNEIIKEISQEIEGIAAAQEIYRLSQKLNIDMPISEQTYKVLYQNLTPLDAVKNLLGREQKAENIF